MSNDAAAQILRLQSDGFIVTFEYDGDGYEESNKLYTVTKQTNDQNGNPQTLTYMQRRPWQAMIFIAAPGEPF